MILTVVDFSFFLVLRVQVIDIGLFFLQYGSLLYGSAILIPSLALGVRRLHDTGRSGWWLLISLIPFVGAFWLLALFLTGSQPNSNWYGAPPQQSAGYSKKAKIKSAAVALIFASVIWILIIVINQVLFYLMWREHYIFSWGTGMLLFSALALLITAILLLPPERPSSGKEKEMTVFIALMATSTIWLLCRLFGAILTENMFRLLWCVLPAALLFFAYNLYFQTTLRKTAALILQVASIFTIVIDIYDTVAHLSNVNETTILLSLVSTTSIVLPISLLVLSTAFLPHQEKN